jgi:putative ABC transport system permease protein
MAAGLPRGEWLGRFADLSRDALPFVARGRDATVPLAWRNMLADRRRLLRSTSGIAFAVLLMLLQLGFRSAFLDSALEVIRNVDGDIVLVSATKFRFGRQDAFPRRQLYGARGVEGVASARPIYAEWLLSSWKNPQTGMNANVQVLAFDPDQPVFLFPEVGRHIEALRQPDTALFDTRARDFIGQAPAGTVSELARRIIRIVGTFALGPDFTTDGTIITSDRTFMNLFPSHRSPEGELTDVEVGVIKVRSGHTVADVQRALRRALPESVAVLTIDEFIALEMKFQNDVSPAGPVFLLGVLIGFVVGLMISYQILYTDLSDQMPQYATLKAIGYENGYLVRVVLEQSLFYAVAGFLPAWLIGIGLYHLIGELALLPMRLGPGIVLGTFALTVGMCVLAGVLAVRAVLTSDPAEVF